MDAGLWGFKWGLKGLTRGSSRVQLSGQVIINQFNLSTFGSELRHF